jgi:ectoine hydroxylase-related dioxygenase (phytanoyl-CoA dioxygenase family)
MTDIRKVVDKLKNDNFVIIKNFFDKKVLSEIKVEIKILKEAEMNRRDKHFIKVNDKLILSSMHNIHLYSTYYKNLILDSKLRDIVKLRYGSTSKRIFNSSLFAKPKNVGLSTKIHQDNAFFNLNNAEALTCWVAIDKSDKDNGGLFYYKGSSKLGLVNHIPEGNLGASMTIEKTEEFKRLIKKFKKVFIDVSPGDCVIHDALVVHGSKSNISNKNRRAFNFSIASRDSINKKKLNLYKNKLKKFLDDNK